VFAIRRKGGGKGRRNRRGCKKKGCAKTAMLVNVLSLKKLEKRWGKNQSRKGPQKSPPIGENAEKNKRGGGE